MSAYLIDIRHFRSSASSRDRKLHPVRRILRNHVARLGANSPSNKPLLKKKRKTLITFVSLIFTTFDRIVMPLSLIPFCPSPSSVRPFKLPRSSRISVLSTDRPVPLAPLLHSRRYSRPFRRRRRITEILKYGILLALLAPPSFTYDAVKLNFLSCRLLGVWVRSWRMEALRARDFLWLSDAQIFSLWLLQYNCVVVFLTFLYFIYLLHTYLFIIHWLRECITVD